MRPGQVVRSAFPAGVPVLGDLVRARLVGVFGPPPIDASAAPGDQGLCGPDSASWPIIGDPAAIIGGVRGLMTQVLHPGAMAGVADHSAFASDPLGRLERTTAWVLASTFGATSEALAMARRVRGVHTRVVGTTPNGRPYRADDPHLLAWVQIALTSSFLATDAVYAAEPSTRRDAFVLEQSRLACLLDERVDLDGLQGDALRSGALDDDLPMLADGVLPHDEADLTRLLAEYEWELEVNHQATEAVAFLVKPPLPIPLRPAYGIVYLGAVATFEDATRRRLGLPLPVPAKIAMGLARAQVAALRIAAGPSQVVRAAQRRAG